MPLFHGVKDGHSVQSLRHVFFAEGKFSLVLRLILLVILYFSLISDAFLAEGCLGQLYVAWGRCESPYHTLVDGWCLLDDEG